MADEDRVKLEAGWKQALHEEFAKPYMRALGDFLRAQKAAGKQIYPPGGLIFNALNSTPLAQTKVVILGQDPYHGPGQAHGLCFSVPPGVPAPPSLQNIFKELKRDLNIEVPAHGCLQSWAEQGVLLLNTCLTVEDGQPASHAGLGWELFTDALMGHCSRTGAAKAFLLWGAHAQKKRGLIDGSRHVVLEANHPSPLSARRPPVPFLGCGHFSTVNRWLVGQGQAPIAW